MDSQVKLFLYPKFHYAQQQKGISFFLLGSENEDVLSSSNFSQH